MKCLFKSIAETELQAPVVRVKVSEYITKTCLFKYTENITTKK